MHFIYLSITNTHIHTHTHSDLRVTVCEHPIQAILIKRETLALIKFPFSLFFLLYLCNSYMAEKKRFVFAERKRALQMAATCGLSVVEEQQELRGYQIYIVEQW